MTAKKRVRPGRCACCSHPDRVQIELLRCAGSSYEALGAQFNLSADSIWRHFKSKHITDRRKTELLAGPARVNDLVNSASKESKSLLDFLSIMRGVLFQQFLAAAESNDRQGVVSVASQLLASLRQLGQVTGELRQMAGLTINNNTVNIAASPEFVALGEGLLGVIRRHPAARDDIVAVIRQLEAARAARPGELARYPDEPPMIEAEAIEETADVH
jgi:hypothetical protein